MNGSWISFLLLTLFCLLAQAFCAMFEMAAVSFNKIRLQYYVSRKMRRARWLNHLIHHPAQLFGTALIGINAFLQLGSESSRRLYETWGWNPDFAPITQIVLVMLFAELSPLFAGRRYAEQIALTTVPVFYFLSKIFSPLIWLFDLFCQLINRCMGATQKGGLYLSREELQKVLEERDDSKEFNRIVGNIFSLKAKKAKELMTSLRRVQMVPSFCTISELRRLLSLHYSPFVPIYHGAVKNVIAVAYPRDLLRLRENSQVRDHGRKAWFITEEEPLLPILKQFRHNNQTLAVVLDKAGSAVGILTLDAILDEIFGQIDRWISIGESPKRQIFVERSFPDEMKVTAFNRAYHAYLEPEHEEETLGDFMQRHLGHAPIKGESLRLHDFEFVVEEVSLRGIKSLLIRTLN